MSACLGVGNLFSTYLTAFVPAARKSSVRAGVLIVLIGVLSGVNYRGVTDGEWLSNFFTVTKVLLLTLFVAAGVTALAMHPGIRVTPAEVPADARDWFAAVLLMVYAYGGFEAALFASGEASNPRKDAPSALAIALVTATLLYVAVQYVVIYTLANPAVARLFMYGGVAAALPALRRKRPGGATFRLPGGTGFAAVALVFTGLLLTTARWGEFAVVFITFGIAAANWFWARGRKAK